MRRFLSEYGLSLLLLFVPIGLWLEHGAHAAAPWVFLASALAIVPLAGWMGRATEHLAERLGAGLGALLNATFGNAAELIIAIIALRAGLYDLVKASITGSIIGNILLVFGLAAFLGGFKRARQQFNRTAAANGATLLLLSAVGLVIPAVFHLVVGEGFAASERGLSLDISVVLMVTYVASLLFTLKTHSHLYLGIRAQSGPPEPAEGRSDSPGPEHAHHPWPAWVAVVVLVVAAALVGVMSELLVGATEEAAHAFGMSEVFVGVILVALVGNAAEHSTAVLMAMKNKMDLAINIAVGSSIQVALFVAPLLVFLSYVIGPQPMDLLFTTFEVVAVAISVLVMAQISQDGESHWMEGLQLLAVYLVIGIAFFFLPG
ncbi:MAG: calcium/proton exchanger [Gemmatimonadota bacterium]